MRFVFAICILACLSGTSTASPWDIVPVMNAADHVPKSTLRPLQIQRGAASQNLQTLDGLTISIAAKNLGNISALTIGPDGTLYVADKKSGRIWALPDRRLDGEIDQRRPLPMRFDTPSGLAVIGETLYAADKRAIWKVAPGQDPVQLASLTNVKTTGNIHALANAQDRQHLLLGLTTTDDAYRVLKIDIETGRADLISEGIGTLHTLSKRKGAEPWISADNKLQSLFSPETALTFNYTQSISAIALPGQFQTPDGWPAQIKDHIIAAQKGAGAMRLIAIPTKFGQPSGDIRVLVDGFLSSSNRSAWGAPGPMVMDKRGLYFADTHNGTILRLSSAPKSQSLKIIEPEPERIPAPVSQSATDKSLLLSGSGVTGSQINTGSTLDTASQLKVGSTQVEAYDKKKAEDKKAKAEKKKAKKTFRKR